MPDSKEIVDKLGRKWNFVNVQDPSILLPVLKERHPISCMMFNQVVQHKDFKDVQTFCTIGEHLDSDTWIFSKIIREDYGCNYSISAPVQYADEKLPIPDYIKECILNGGLVQWDMTDEIMFFTPQTSVHVAKMIIEISADKAGNVTEIHPGFLYYMERDDALNLKIDYPIDPNVELRRINESENDFLVKTWKYSRSGSDLEFAKCLERNASGGVFVNGECVCGVHVPAIGFLSALYTLKEHRNKGYAKITMNYTFKEYTKDGCIPCLFVETSNQRSMRFHEGLGLKIATSVYGILVKRLGID